MKHLTDTIREALEFFECGSYSTSKALSALTALSELERMAVEPVAWKHDCAALLANDVELWIDNCPHCGRPRAAPPAKQQQYEAGDMASAHNDGFRAGVASVAQQPQEIEVVCPVCSHTFYAWPGEHKVQQPQAEAVPLLTKDFPAVQQARAVVQRQADRYRDLMMDDAAPQQAEAPVAWPTMPPSKGQSPVLFEDGYAEGWAKCLSACKSLFPAQQPQAEAVRDADVEAAAKKMAEIFDYPWDFMPEKGRNTMRENVRAVLTAAQGANHG